MACGLLYSANDNFALQQPMTTRHHPAAHPAAQFRPSLLSLAALAALKHFSFDTVLFPVNYALCQTGFGPQVLELARCEWIERRENVITLGPSGTGKTHVALGLGLAACQKGHSVGFTTAAALVHELMEARDERRLLRLQKHMVSHKLLIIDELGFVPLSKTGAELLFELISQRYERGATLITSNLPFDEWTSVFGSERLTGALLDRLTHHVSILSLNGDSYRLKASRSRRGRLDGGHEDEALVGDRQEAPGEADVVGAQGFGSGVAGDKNELGHENADHRRDSLDMWSHGGVHLLHTDQVFLAVDHRPFHKSVGIDAIASNVRDVRNLFALRVVGQETIDIGHDGVRQRSVLQCHIGLHVSMLPVLSRKGTKFPAKCLTPIHIEM